MTVTVKAIDSQRWICLTHVFQLNVTSSEGEPGGSLDSRLLRRLRRPVGLLNTELLGVLPVQPLPAELHRLATNDAADGSSAEKVIQNIETNVPPGSTH